jgi:hypothetical protein
MKNPKYRWVLSLLRYGLCIVALAWLYRTVDWYDYVRLDDAEKTRVRLVGEQDGGFVVIRDGGRITIPSSAVAHVVVDGVSRPDIDRGIAGVIARTDLNSALLALAIFLPVPFLSAVRLVWMLAIQSVRLRLWNSVKLTFVGNFFNFALPGSTGGDLIKAYYITRFTDRKTEAVTTVFLDRVVGLLSLVIMAGFMILFTADPQHYRRLGLILGLVSAGLAVGAVFVFSRRLRHAIGLPQLAEKLPMGHQLLRIGRTLVAMRSHKGLVLLALGITFALQTIALISFCVFAAALGMEGGFARFFIYIAIGFLFAAIPIAPPQAIGVLEWWYIQSFARGGLNSDSQAVALALAVRVIQLIWALPGVLVPMLGAHLPSESDLAQLDAEEPAAAARAAAVGPIPTPPPVPIE